jgi:hypothetical protein
MKVFYYLTCFECYYIHPQEPATVCRCIVLFRCVLVYWCGSAGVVWYPNAGWCTSAPTCIRIPPYSSRTAPIHQYTPKKNNTPTYSRRLLRMNVITFETCWAIKTFIKWHQVRSIYSTIYNILSLLYLFLYFRLLPIHWKCRELVLPLWALN